MLLVLAIVLLPAAAANETRRLRHELERAKAALAEIWSLLPATRAWHEGVHNLAENCTAHSGYSGVFLVGTSATRVKTVTVNLWATSAVLPSVGGLVLQQPLDKFALSVLSVHHDSFVLRVERTDVNGGWGQQLWGEYTVSGAFHAMDIRQPGRPGGIRSAAAWPETLKDARTAQARLAAIVEGYWDIDPAVAASLIPLAEGLKVGAGSMLPANTPMSTRSTTPHVLPLLRHLGGNFANVETIWQALIQSHPNPSAATVIEVGVAHGEQAMFAADAGVNVIAIEPKRQWIESPMLLSKARARPNLQLVRAAATAKDGVVRFSAGAASTGSHIIRGGSRGRGQGNRRGQSPAYEEVRSLRIDSLLQELKIPDVYVVKIDVQGFVRWAFRTHKPLCFRFDRPVQPTDRSWAY